MIVLVCYVCYYVCFESLFLDYFGYDCVVLLHVLLVFFSVSLIKLNFFVWIFWMDCWLCLLMLDSCFDYFGYEYMFFFCCTCAWFSFLLFDKVELFRLIFWMDSWLCLLMLDTFL